MIPRRVFSIFHIVQLWVVVSLLLFFGANNTRRSSSFSAFAALPSEEAHSSCPSSSLSSSSRSAHHTAFQPQNIMRAWHCHGRNQRELVDRLAQAGIVTAKPVRDVMSIVDRQYYLPASQRQNAYLDAPQAIGLGQTISAPHMHAHVLEEMLPYLQKQDAPLKVLDVGCGSGYLTACLGRWFQPRPQEQDSTTNIAGLSTPTTTSATTTDSNPNAEDNVGMLGKPGKVFGIDIFPHLVELSKENMSRNDSDLLMSGKVTLQVGNGWNGLAAEGPYDAIHVGAAASDFPIQLAMQLKVGGVLLVPVGPTGGVQNLYKIERLGGSIDNNNNQEFSEKDYRVTELLGVRYVPLIERPN